MSIKTSILAATLFGLSAITFAATAQTPDITTWEITQEVHPAGTVHKQGDAIVARYPIAALEAASAGQMSKVTNSPPRDRMETALSIISMGMSEFEMTTLFGMPAIIGTVETSDGPRHFAAALSGRAGSDRELLSVFTAPRVDFDRMGGLDMLKANRPKAKTYYAGMETTPNPSAGPSPTPATPKSAPTRTANAPSPPTPPQRSTSGADLLAGVLGDLDRISEQNAKILAAERAEKAEAKAKADKLERQRLYKASGARKGFYPPLSDKMEYLEWPRSGNWNVQVLDDPRSPRIKTLSLEGGNNPPEKALYALIKDTGLRITGKIRFEALESYSAFDGRDLRILLTETQMQSDKGVAFILYGMGKGSDTATIIALEMPLKTYQAWGGVAGMLRMRGVVQSVDVFPKAERKRIANASLEQQMTFYETVLDKFYMTESISLMMTQARTTAMMTELNYDLLFGDDITSPFIAD